MTTDETGRLVILLHQCEERVLQLVRAKVTAQTRLSICLTAGQLVVTFLDDDDEHETTHTADKVNTSLAPSSLLYQTYVSRHRYLQRGASIE